MDDKQKYDEIMTKAMSLYNRNVWGNMNKRVSVISVNMHDKGIDFVENLGRVKKLTRMNSRGQIIKYGVLMNPYTYDEIPEKKIKGLNETISLYQQAIELFPEKANPYKWLGRSYHYLGLLDEAIKYYRIAIKLRPQFKEDLDYRIKEGEEQKKGKQAFVIEKDEEELPIVEEKDFKYINTKEYKKHIKLADKFKEQNDVENQIFELEKSLALLEKSVELESNEKNYKKNETSMEEFDFIYGDLADLRIYLSELYYKNSINLEKIGPLLKNLAIKAGNLNACYWLLKDYERKKDRRKMNYLIKKVKGFYGYYETNDESKIRIRKYIIQLKRKLKNDK